MFIDRRKSEQGVGSGVVIFKGNTVIDQLRIRLDNLCFNNQAEQLAIVKALEALHTIQDTAINPKQQLSTPTVG